MKEERGISTTFIYGGETSMMPQDACLPDYSGNGIVNVMSAIEALFGGNNPYPTHAKLSKNEIKKTKNIVLIAVDGFGFNFFEQHFKNSGLNKYLAGGITSVFPSTTAAAMTTIYTGMAPLNHAILAWFTYFKELGVIGIMPPMLVRGDKGLLVKGGVDPAKLLGIEPMFDRIHARCFMLSPSDFLKKPYNIIVAGRGQQVGFGKFDEMLDRTANVVKNNPGEKLVLSYWPTFDQIAHEAGTTSPAALDHAKYLVDCLASFIENFKPQHPDTTIIITADHGMIDATPGDLIRLESHPGLKDTLAMPLCGEPRAAFCYVRPSKAGQFEEYVDRHLSHACTAAKIQDVLAEGIFGKFDPHPCLFDRVGDYILFMKDRYILKDLLLGETRTPLIGH
ncbi:MAG: alkaline phosphatase family protein, partial [Candidatus Sigynarchaeota archaeon]